MRRAGVNPDESDSVIDLGAGKNFSVVTTDFVGTLTKSRCAQRALWLTNVLASILGLK